MGGTLHKNFFLRASLMFTLMLAFVLGFILYSIFVPPKHFEDFRGQQWRINLSPQNLMPFHGIGISCGFTDDTTHTIWINRSVALCGSMRETLLHELMHVVATTELSESTITVHASIYLISPGLAEIFARNQRLLLYMAVR